MCNVCQHNQIQNIDRLLLGGASPTAVGRKFGYDPADMARHHEHLKQKMALAAQRFHASLYQGLLCKLNNVLEMVLGVVWRAKDSGDFKLFLQATREVTRLVNLMLKMKVRLEPEMIYCLAASPQWDLQNSLLPDAMTGLMQTRETLKLNLFTPCPEPDPVSAVPCETRNSELETPPAAAPPETVNEPQKPAGHTPTRQKREKSAKKARKITLTNKVNEEYQEDIRREKNAPKKREKLWQRLFGKWEKSGKLPGKTALTEGICKSYE